MELKLEKFESLEFKSFDEDVELTLAPNTKIIGCSFKKVKVKKHPDYGIDDYIAIVELNGHKVIVPNVYFGGNRLQSIELEIPITITSNIIIVNSFEEFKG